MIYDYLEAEKEDVLEKVLEELFVESMLQQAQIVLTGAELVQESEEESHEKRQDRRKEIFSWIEKHFSLFFLLAEEKEEQTGDFPGQTVSMEGQDHISQEHIRQAVKQNQQNQLGSYATLINSCFLWEDLILGEEQKA